MQCVFMYPVRDFVWNMPKLDWSKKVLEGSDLHIKLYDVRNDVQYEMLLTS